jgi:hypothetical protein
LLSTFLIVLRDGVEATLVAGIIPVYPSRAGRVMPGLCDAEKLWQGAARAKQGITSTYVVVKAPRLKLASLSRMRSFNCCKQWTSQRQESSLG